MTDADRTDLPTSVPPQLRSPEVRQPPALPVERLIFFTDAAVAIAMTLLILPLMEGVSEAAAEGLDAFEYLREASMSLLSLALSFVIIARFWRSHHRLFASLESEPPRIFWLNMAWLFSIVCLPVATALVGAMPEARPQYAVYIGNLLVCALLMTAMVAVARQHPQSWLHEHVVTDDSLAASLTVCLLFATALMLALLVPSVGYWWMLLLLLSSPVHRLMARLLGGSARAPQVP